MANPRAQGYHTKYTPTHKQPLIVSFLPSPDALADRDLVLAAQNKDLKAMMKALEGGASPNARRPCRGLVGEPVALWLTRHGDWAGLDAVLRAGAKIDTGTIVAACLLVERATLNQDQEALDQAKAVVDTLEHHHANWGVCDRFIGGGLRAIDLLASAQPQWARGPADRLKLTPLTSTEGIPEVAKPGRKRREGA